MYPLFPPIYWNTYISAHVAAVVRDGDPGKLPFILLVSIYVYIYDR